MRKLMNKKLNKKGFTLMEMLIVVAIIAILVAIAIPTFTGALDRAKASADAANIRAGYATLQANAMLDPTTYTDGSYILQGDGTVKKSTDTGAATNAYKCQAKSDKLGADVNIGGVTTVAWDEGKTVTYTLTKGVVKAIAATA